jgi:hypothetical protein
MGESSKIEAALDQPEHPRGRGHALPNELSPLGGRHSCRCEYLGLLLFGYTFVAGAIRASKSLNVKRCTNGPISTSASPAVLREIAS